MSWWNSEATAKNASTPQRHLRWVSDLVPAAGSRGALARQADDRRSEQERAGDVDRDRAGPIAADIGIVARPLGPTAAVVLRGVAENREHEHYHEDQHGDGRRRGDRGAGPWVRGLLLPLSAHPGSFPRPAQGRSSPADGSL